MFSVALLSTLAVARARGHDAPNLASKDEDIAGPRRKRDVVKRVLKAAQHTATGLIPAVSVHFFAIMAGNLVLPGWGTVIGDTVGSLICWIV